MFKEELNFKVAYLLPYNLQYFAKEGSGGEKTEEATMKKLTDARKEGQVAKSTELITASALASLFIILRLFIGFISNRLIEMFYKTYQSINKIVGEEFTINAALGILKDVFFTILLACVPVFVTGVAVSFIVIVYQVKWKITGKPLQPKLNKINPISGFKKIFSKDKIFELIISIVKILIITYIAYDTLKDEWPTLLRFYDLHLNQAVLLIGTIVINLGLKISVIFIIVGLADLIYQKMKFKREMRMTKQEVKDEYKQSEGDPLIKSKIRNKMREASQRRMMQALPQADVVITNPTHFAAAIKYDKDASQAPVLIAKGADYLAHKMKEIAKENNIEIVENKPLARMLYYNVDIDTEIPPELYQMTAEVLAYVYGLKNKM